MSAPPYMKFFWTDYFAKTRRLNKDEHSAYLLLLGEMWIKGGKLPDDDQILADLCLCTPEEWAAVRPKVMAFFTPARGAITQKRLAEEMAAYADTVAKRKIAGKKGSSVSNEKQKGIRAAIADQLPTQPEPEPEPELELELEPKKKDLPDPKKGNVHQLFEPPPKPKPTRLSESWELDLIGRQYALTKGVPSTKIGPMAERFKNYWISQPGRQGTKLDWQATWRNWVLGWVEKNPPAPKSHGQW